MMGIAVDFYKNLFVKEHTQDVKLDANFWNDGDNVTREENDLLV